MWGWGVELFTLNSDPDTAFSLISQMRPEEIVGNLLTISPNNHKYFLYDRLPPASRCIEKFDGKTNPTLILLWKNQKYIYGCCIFPTREASHVLLCELQQISESAQSDNLAHNKHLSLQKIQKKICSEIKQLWFNSFEMACTFLDAIASPCS